MYNALRSLLKMKSILIITILQLSFGISLLNYVTGIKQVSKDKIEILESLFDTENTYLSRPNQDFSNEEQDKNPFLSIPKVINDLEELKERGIIKTFGGYYTTSISNKITAKAIGKDFLVDNSGKELINTLLIDKSIALKRNPKVLKGRGMEDGDFEKDYKTENIPIWIGSELKDKFKIGDTFEENAAKNVELENDDLVFEVVGILEPNQFPVILAKEQLVSALKYLNELIVIPTVKNFFDYGSEVILFDMGSYVELSPNVDFKSYQKMFKKICEDAGYGFQSISLKEDIENTLGNLDKELQQTIILGILLIILSIVGIISVMLGSIRRRYNEFGIKISQGASIKRIMKELIYEILIMIAGAILLSFIFLAFKEFKTAISLELIWTNIIFLISISIIVTIPVILKIRKLNIVDLVRGK